MPVLYNAETGLAENLSAEAAQAALASGTHEVPMVDPEGNLGSVAHKEASSLLGQGYKQPSPEQLTSIMDTAKNSSAVEQLKGAAEGAAEMVAPVVGTQVEKVFGAKESDIRRRRETTGHTVGQLAGVLVPGLGELGAAKAALAPTAEALAKIAAEKTVANRIGSTAAKFAVENAVFAGKDEVAKLMVHEPEQSSDTALANIGMAALLGGAIGAGGQGAAELWKLGPGAKLGQIMDGLKNKSSGLGVDLKSTAGIELAPEVLSALGDNPKAREAAQVLMESNSKAGAELQASMKDFHAKASEATAEALGHTQESISSLEGLSKAETGRAFQEALAKNVAEKIEPIAKKYDAITEKFSGHTLSEFDKADIADKVAAHIQEAGLAKGPNEQALNLAEKVLEQLPKQETVQDLRKYAQGLYQTAPFGNEKYATGKALRGIFSQTIDDVVGKEAGGEFKVLQAEYGKFKGLLEDLNDRLHAGKESKAGAESFSKAVRAMDPEDVVRRLSLKTDSNLQALLVEHFPEVAEASKQYELNTLIKKSLNKEGSGIDINKFSKNLAALEPEHRNHLMNAEMLKRVEAIQELVQKVPGKMNSSGTAKTLDKLWEKVPAGVGALLSFMTGHNPVMGAIFGQMSHFAGRELPDSARLAMLKFMGSEAPTSAGGFAAAMKVAGAIAKGEKAVSNAAAYVLKGGAALSYDGLAKDRDKLEKHLEAYQSDPEKFLSITGETGHYMPNQAALMTSSASKAVQYLNSLRPNSQPQSPLDGPVTVSKAAQAKYARALDIANKPLIVAESMRDGALTAADVAHLTVLYPALANRLRAKLGQEMIDAKAAGISVPYKTVQSLSLFMQQPLESSLKQPAIMANQPLPQNMPNPARMPKVTGAKMDKLGKLPGLYETPQQHRSMYRTSKH